MTLKFSVLGEPRGKARPRFSRQNGKVVTFTDKQTQAYENYIKVMFKRAHPDRCFPEGAMLDLRVIAYFGIPQSASQKRRTEMLAGGIRPTKRPDADNILKAVADSLNGLAYHDDAQLVDTQIRKFYSAQPRIEITIQDTGNKCYEQMQL